MTMNQFPAAKTRLGFHYYPDSLHYTQADLRRWLPEIEQSGAGWLVVEAPTRRAIPEDFISGLLGAQIQPVLHFNFGLADLPDRRELTKLLEQYARWGVQMVCLFDRPNQRSNWLPGSWQQAELVERFLDHYLPGLHASLELGMVPVFPPLEPGGDYWDTTFLRAALQGLERRASDLDLNRLALGAYAWSAGKPLAWGAGGPERWAGARPYYTPPGEQDQRGVRIFEWYSAIAGAVLGWTPQVILLGIAATQTADEHTRHSQNETLARWLAAGSGAYPNLGAQVGEPTELPANLLAGCLYLLAANVNSPEAEMAWCDEQGRRTGTLESLRGRYAQRSQTKNSQPRRPNTQAAKPIEHYLLLPAGAAPYVDNLLNSLQSFLAVVQPTVGFSLQEASLAQQVTIAGSPDQFHPADLESLAVHGCQVAYLNAVGTQLAS